MKKIIHILFILASLIYAVMMVFPGQGLGIAQDIRVVQTEADIELGRDKQLEFAIDMLK